MCMKVKRVKPLLTLNNSSRHGKKPQSIYTTGSNPVT